MGSLAVRFSCDLRGQIVAVGTATEPRRFGAFSYGADGRISGATLAGSPKRSFAYDTVARLAALDDPCFSVSLGYRVGGAASGPFGDGGITAEATAWKPAPFGGKEPAATSRAYRRDKYGRLIEVQSSRAVQSLVQSYDADGNILQRKAGGAKQSAFAYEVGSNRLARVTPEGGTAMALAHDADGAVRRAGGLALSHDGPASRASGVRTSSARMTYLANAEGERVLAIVAGEGGTRRLTVRSGSEALTEIDAAGTGEAYVYGPGAPIALVTDGRTDHAISTNHRGSVLAAWTGSTVAAQFDYQPFGALERDNSQASTPLAARLRQRYTGQTFDPETGLYDYHARLYDPELGRFLSPDPAGQLASPYAYAGNDPVDFVDPTGKVFLATNVAHWELTGYTRLALLTKDNEPIMDVLFKGIKTRRILADIQQAIRSFNKKLPTTHRIAIASDLEKALGANRYDNYVISAQECPNLSDIGVFTVDRLTRKRHDIRYKFYINASGPGPAPLPPIPRGNVPPKFSGSAVLSSQGGRSSASDPVSGSVFELSSGRERIVSPSSKFPSPLKHAPKLPRLAKRAPKSPPLSMDSSFEQESQFARMGGSISSRNLQVKGLPKSSLPKSSLPKSNPPKFSFPSGDSYSFDSDDEFFFLVE